MLSELQVQPVTRHVTRDTWNTRVSHAGHNDEKWLTKKKVEIVTTKNVEKTVKRQLVLEDGRVLDEDIPVVTLDTTENKEIFETDGDEERDNDGGDMNIGDRVTTLKTVRDVKENVTKTEAAQNIGTIANRDIAGVIRDKSKLNNVLRRPNISGIRDLAVKTIPVVVHNSRNHSTVTDTEQVKQRNVKRGGRMLMESIRTEQHEEYESNDCQTSDDEGDFEKIEFEELYLEEPKEYKTKTEESFIEYFQNGQNQDNKFGMVKVGDGPHFRGESKQYSSKNTKSHKMAGVPHKPLKQSRSWDNDREDKLGIKLVSKQHSSSLSDLSRNGAERVFIAKVIDETPAVRLRNKKKQDINRYMEHRQSANFSSSGNVIQNPSSNNSSRCSTPTSKEYHFRNCRVKDNYRRERPMSLDISNMFDSKTREHTHAKTYSNQQFSTLRNQRSYHSNLDISEKPKQIEIKIESPTHGDLKLIPKHYASSDNLLKERNICTKSLVRKSNKFQSIGDICFTTSKEIPNLQREVVIRRENAFSSLPSSRKNSGESLRKSSGGSSRSSNDRKTSGRLIFTSEKPSKPILNRSLQTSTLEKGFKTSSCTNLSTRVIPIDISGSLSPISRASSPSTKYRTRVAVHGAA